MASQLDPTEAPGQGDFAQQATETRPSLVAEICQYLWCNKKWWLTPIILMLLLGPAWGLLTNVLLYLPFTIFLLITPYTGHVRDAGRPRRPLRLGLGGMVALVGEARAERRLMTMILLGAATSFFVGNAFQAQMPEYAHRLGAGEAKAWYSILLAANAAGALLGAILLESLDVPPSARAAIMR